VPKANTDNVSYTHFSREKMALKAIVLVEALAHKLYHNWFFFRISESPNLFALLRLLGVKVFAPVLHINNNKQKK
jgi:hypothetical protein